MKCNAGVSGEYRDGFSEHIEGQIAFLGVTQVMGYAAMSQLIEQADQAYARGNEGVIFDGGDDSEGDFVGIIVIATGERVEFEYGDESYSLSRAVVGHLLQATADYVRPDQESA
ncbi:MAG TPA: hypothetical protein VF733_03075 [Candidatus Saccharimonadales bacterium]